MSQQAPKLVSDTHYCVVGDVSVDSSAAIAPGVVLQAASGSRIIIGEGVCLAAGVCIQSRRGVLTIAAGASLGANVLVVGSGEIGMNACVSAGSTLINPSVNADAILPPDSLVEAVASSFQSSSFQSSSFQSSSFQSNGFQSNGFQSNGFQSNGFQSNSNQNNGFQTNNVQSVQNNFQSNGFQSNGFQASSAQVEQSHSYSSFQTQHSASNGSVQSSYQPERYSTGQNRDDYSGNSRESNGSNSGTSDSSSQMTVRSSYDRVYGREQVTKLISALFPGRQPPG